MTATPHITRWGVMGTGWIASEFVKDLVLDPKGRGVTDVAHSVAAVASRTLQKAEEFINEFFSEGGCGEKFGLDKEKPVALGSYVELVARKDVDIVYIATPHTQHFEGAKMALEAGKNVLVEKPATLNAAEAKVLIELAKSKNVFLMEGVWTRFFPLVAKFQDLLFTEKAIGTISQVFADFGIAFYGNLPDTHRLFNPDLAGGAQLDLGPYTTLWALLALYHHPENERTAPSGQSSSIMPHPKTGVDLFSTVTLDFDKLGARANLTCNTVATSPTDVCVRVLGSKGQLIIPTGCSRPQSIVLRRYTSDNPFEPAYKDETLDFEIQGMGLHWEADAVARSLRDGKKENEKMPWDETMLVMQIFDTWREQSGYKYPEDLEKVKA